MKNFKTVVFVVFSFLFLTSSVLPQNNPLFEKFKIPTYKLQYLEVYGQDFLNFRSVGSDNSYLKVNLGAKYKYESQSPMQTLRVWEDPEINYTKDKVNGKDIDALTIITNNLKVKYQNYFMAQEKGLFGFANADLNFESRSDSVQLPNGKYKSSKTGLPLSFGLGYGRVVVVKSVAQAMAIGKELGVKLTDDQILKIADAIDRLMDGTFSKIHKDNAEIEFFNEVATITGSHANVPKINQIVSSAAYKIINRSIGWQAMVGYSNIFLDEGTIKVGTEDYSFKGDVMGQFDYAQPIGMDKQFTASAAYYMSLEDKDKLNPYNILSLNAAFGIEHSLHWATTISLAYEGYTANKGDAISFVEVKAKTDYYILSKFSTYASLSYSKAEARRSGIMVVPTGIKDATIDFKLGFKYWVF